jgi:hypothetical protein
LCEGFQDFIVAHPIAMFLFETRQSFIGPRNPFLRGQAPVDRGDEWPDM